MRKNRRKLSDGNGAKEKLEEEMDLGLDNMDEQKAVEAEKKEGRVRQKNGQTKLINLQSNQLINQIL